MIGRVALHHGEFKVSGHDTFMIMRHDATTCCSVILWGNHESPVAPRPWKRFAETI